MHDSAIHGWLLRFRAFGMRLPVDKIEPIQGAVVCIDRYGSFSGEASTSVECRPNARHVTFYARFHRPGKSDAHHLELHGAVLIKESAGVWQFAGDEWNAEVKRHYRQTWVCAPDEATAREILSRLSSAG